MGSAPKDYNLEEMETHYKKYESYIAGIETSAKKLVSDATGELDGNSAKLVKELVETFNAKVMEFLKIPQNMAEYMSAQIKRTRTYDQSVNG